jgi:uncharacterized protein (DUF342 family)
MVVEKKPINPPIFGDDQTIKSLASRLAFIEERYKTFESRLRQVQKNVVDHHHEMRRLIKSIDKQVLAQQALLVTMTDRMKTLRNEIILRASKEDLAVVKKYIDLWNPFQFVTSDQVEDIVREVMREKKV